MPKVQNLGLDLLTLLAIAPKLLPLREGRLGVVRDAVTRKDLQPYGQMTMSRPNVLGGVRR